jgi:SAM-dependent methyltransferase
MALREACNQPNGQTPLSRFQLLLIRALLSSRKIDETKQKAFMEKLLQDFSGTYATLLCCIGDRLGLFRDLALNGQTTSGEFAKRNGINQRYAKEWLNALFCAGYLEYDPVTDSFGLSPEQASFLADEKSRTFFAGKYQYFQTHIRNYDKIVSVFLQGGGVPMQEYGDDMWDGMERSTQVKFEHQLVQEWIEQLPEVKAALEKGVSVADIGAGRGRALIKLAQTFPNSRFVGFDAFGPTVAIARQNAAKAGVSENLSFFQLDAAKGLPEKYDLITTFDVIHDAVDPRGTLRAICRALKTGGIYLMLEDAPKERLEENRGPAGALSYSTSIFYCMTTSLANGGEGLGTMGLPESKLRDYCKEAGFRNFRKLPIDVSPDALYELKA